MNRIQKVNLTQCFNPMLVYNEPGGKRKFLKYSKTETQKIARQAKTDCGKPDYLLPCGICMACIRTRARDWQKRALDEQMFQDHMYFITLTYSDENIPLHNSLSKKDHTLFLKRLRHYYPEADIKYLGCGEYGTQTKRPHFHYVVAGFEITDLEFAKKSNQHDLFTSKTIEKAWQEKGHVWIGEFDVSEVGYIMGYLHKKIITKKQREIINPETGLRPYERIDQYSGEIISIEPEFQRQSTRPAWGRKFFEKYNADMNTGYLIYNGLPCSIPRTYMRWMEKEFPQRYEKIKAKMSKFAEQKGILIGDSTWDRLDAREHLAEIVNSRFQDRSAT